MDGEEAYFFAASVDASFWLLVYITSWKKKGAWAARKAYKVIDVPAIASRPCVEKCSYHVGFVAALCSCCCY